MLSFSSTLVVLGYLAGVLAVPAPQIKQYAVKERHAVPRGWTAISRPDAHQSITLQIGLKQQNQDKLEQHVVEVSDPSHARYGQYLSADEVHDLVAPADDTVGLVQAWLHDHNITTSTLSATKDWIYVTLPVKKIEHLLQAEYSVYRNHEDDSTLVRATEWSLPIHLHEHIDVIQPTTSFFRPIRKARPLRPEPKGMTWNGGHWWKPPQSPRNSSAPCSVATLCNTTSVTMSGRVVASMDLDCLRCLYGTFDYVPRAADKNSVAVTNYLNETIIRADLQLFLDTYRPEAAHVAQEFPVTSVANGGNFQVLSAEDVADYRATEGNLDGELVVGISYPTPFSAWVTGGEPPFLPDIETPTDSNEPYLSWLNYVLAQQSLPLVISTSYGDGLMALGARGITVLFGSGDSGVGPDGTCFSNVDNTTAMLLPVFPSSCPWVTSIGATAGYLPEVAVTRFASGAGFSNYFGMPAYQASTVKGYLSKIGDLNAGLYNDSGRAYPDIAAAGNYDIIVWNGNFTLEGGTSAATPTVAGVFALVNDALLAAGRPTLGFVNPWLYSSAYTAFTDITNGSSYGCDTDGFPATEGWDAVTGFGTPNFGKLVAAAFARGGGGGGGGGGGWSGPGHFGPW